MYSNNRDAYRLAFFMAWEKYQKKLPLEPVETQLIEVILLHPEYQGFLDKAKRFQQQEFSLEENPFFHMSLHMAIREQVKLDRPAGIADIFTTLTNKLGNAFDAEHAMMTCLAEMIWSAQSSGSMPVEADYLNKLRAL